MKWNAAIIGLGQIGMGYDFDQTGVQLTHATGYHEHPDFRLIAGIDPNPERRSLFEKKFKARSYSSIEEFVTDPANAATHCISIASPSRDHAKSFFEIQKYKKYLPQLGAILCEKPISDSLEEARKMLAQAKAEKWLLAVNYIRRTIPEFRALQSEIQNGDWGTLQKGIVFYTKGLLNSASHWIDLMRFFFGEPTDVRLLAKGSRRPIVSEVQDYEPDFLLQFKESDIYFCACDDRQYTLGTVELLMTNGCIKIYDSGIFIDRFSIGRDSLTPQLQVLLPNPKTTKTHLSQNMRFVLDDLTECLRTKKLPISDGESGLETLEIASNLIQSTLNETSQI